MSKKINFKILSPVDASDKNQPILKGSGGLPMAYPVPQGIDDLLFYIQRNLDENTVVYQLNRTPAGNINLNEPVNMFWIKYTDGAKKQQLNYVQQKLAYGYTFQEINHHTIELNIVAYPSFRIFIAKDEIGDNYRAYCRVGDEFIQLTNIYVYAEDYGVFPDVKYVDIYGQRPDGGEKLISKINYE